MRAGAACTHRLGRADLNEKAARLMSRAAKFPAMDPAKHTIL